MPVLLLFLFGFFVFMIDLRKCSHVCMIYFVSFHRTVLMLLKHDVGSGAL